MMIKKSIMIATIFSVAIIGQSCSKEQKESDSNSNAPTKKSFSTSEAVVTAEVEDFSEQLALYYQGENYSIDNMEMDYAIDLMEATFNYQHAVSIPDFKDDVDNGEFGFEKISYSFDIDTYADISGNEFIEGANVASQFMTLLDALEDSLGEGEYYINTDFTDEGAVSGGRKIGVSAIKVIILPITTITRGWWAMDDQGTCTGGTSWLGFDATDRMTPFVFKGAYSFPGRTTGYLWNFNVKYTHIGYNTNLGPVSGDNYCNKLWGRSPLTGIEPSCGSYKISNECLTPTKLNTYINNMVVMAKNEKPTGRKFAANYIYTSVSPTYVGSPTSHKWHVAALGYGQRGVLDSAPNTNPRNLVK